MYEIKLKVYITDVIYVRNAHVQERQAETQETQQPDLELWASVPVVTPLRNKDWCQWVSRVPIIHRHQGRAGGV